MRIPFLTAALLLAAPAFAACPPPPDIAEAQEALFAEARAATTPAEGQAVAPELWKLWATAPDEPAQALLDRGMEARASWDFLAALDALDRLVDYCPDYAEGYNQRAFVHFLSQNYDAALVDLDLALERAPSHVAAMSGKALTLMGLGRQDEAQAVLREAVALNPWIPEAHLLREPEGEDL